MRDCPVVLLVSVPDHFWFQIAWADCEKYWLGGILADLQPGQKILAHRTDYAPGTCVLVLHRVPEHSPGKERQLLEHTAD